MMILPIVPKSQWRTPSLSQSKDMFGRENRTVFRIDARANDGGLVWRGWFEDRDDADAFLYAAIQGTLKQERALWDLPTPNWQPYLGELISYEFVSMTFLTSPTGSNQTYTFPIDWNNNNNTIETIGAGGSGGVCYGGSPQRNAAGAGGGAYSKILNYVKAGATTTYQIGTGPNGVGAINGSASNGGTGGDTWFGNTTLATSSVGAKGGSAGQGSVSASATGGSGGAAASGIGTTKYSGGKGGNATGGGATSGGGGGGAAGPNGAGNTASDAGAGATAGGSGDNGFGGSGGSTVFNSTGGAGGSGTEFSASYGSGGGGGGGYSISFTGTLGAGPGGNYGGGGGGAGRDGSTPGSVSSGTGASGLIVITYYPPGGLFGGGRSALGMG